MQNNKQSARDFACGGGSGGGDDDIDYDIGKRKNIFFILVFPPFFLDVVVFSHLPCSFRWVAIKTLLLCYMHMRRRDDDGNEANGTVKLTWN